jgi:hypothetical protein
MAELSKVTVSRNTVGLRAPLAKWIRECRRYAEIVNDYCWWYNERTNIGILAVAAAKVKGWAALEEYCLRKGAVDEKGNICDRHGRCDLYLSGTEHGTGFAMEFKQVRQPIGPGVSDQIGMRTLKAMSAAWKDAGHLLADEAGARVAGTFIIPTIEANEYESLRERLEVFGLRLLQLRKQKKVHAVAWYFVDEIKDWIRDGETGKLFPGIALVLKERKRGTGKRSITKKMHGS